MTDRVPIYLNAGFGNPIGEKTLSLIASLSFSGVRQSQDVSLTSPDIVDTLVREFAPSTARHLRLLYVLDSSTGIVRDIIARALLVVEKCEQYGVDPVLEVVNEPDIGIYYRTRPEQWGQLVRVIWETVAPRARVVSGGLQSSTSDRARTYLKKAIPFIPDECTIGVHTYREKSNPATPDPGYSSRKEEFDSLRDLTGARDIWATEVSWSTVPRKKRWYECKSPRPLTEQEIADNFTREFQVYEESRLGIGVLYQLNDGPGESSDDHEGIVTLDGRLKPSAYSVKRYLQCYP